MSPKTLNGCRVEALALDRLAGFTFLSRVRGPVLGSGSFTVQGFSRIFNLKVLGLLRVSGCFGIHMGTKVFNLFVV